MRYTQISWPFNRIPACCDLWRGEKDEDKTATFKAMNLPIPANDVSGLQLLQQIQTLLAERDQQIASLQHQLAWFKQQLFGEKSEKRLIDNPDQLALGEILKDSVPEQDVPTETISYERRKKHRPDDCVTDQGLRFNEDVPVKLIHQPAPEMQGENADQYEVIDHKYTYRLAQRPGSHVILKYQRDVVRHKASQTLTTVAAPTGLFDRSFADVSFIAGMLNVGHTAEDTSLSQRMRSQRLPKKPWTALAGSTK